MTTLHGVLVVCSDVHHIYVKAASNFIPLIHLRGPSYSIGPSSGILSCRSFSVTSLCRILPRWVQLFLFVGLKISSHDGNHCSLITLPHELLVTCVFLWYWKTSHRFIWLVDELSKLQYGLELCHFTQVLLQPGLQDGKWPFLSELTRESNFNTLPDGWRIIRGTQPKGKMSCLESRCYD
jgi:hypothetical protein